VPARAWGFESPLGHRCYPHVRPDDLLRRPSTPGGNAELILDRRAMLRYAYLALGGVALALYNVVSYRHQVRLALGSSCRGQDRRERVSFVEEVRRR
jgi:hypothetical protein